jgi:hypothetical protein
MKNNKVISSHSDTTTLKDGTKLRVVVENYENSLFSLGTPMRVQCKVEYVKSRGTRWVGNFFENHLTDEEMLKEVDHIIAGIQKNENNYKSQFASV